MAPLGLLRAQTVSLKVNGDKIENNGTYHFYPVQYELEISHGNNHYTVSKGTISLSKNNQVLKTVSFRQNPSAQDLQDVEARFPGSRIRIELIELQEQKSKKIYQSHQVFSFRLAATLPGKPVPDSDLSLWIDDSRNYLTEGVKGESIQKVEIRIADQYKSTSVTIMHVRGFNLVKSAAFDDYREFEQSLLELIKDTSVLPGDRLVIQFREAGKFITIPIGYSP